MPTYSTTTVQRFTDALITNLTDKTLHPALAQTVITDGLPPASVLDGGQFLFFGDVKSTREWAAIGNTNRPQNEQYTITGYIVSMTASTANDTVGQGIVTENVLTIFAELEQELRTNPTQGVDLVSGETGGWVKESHISGFELGKYATDTQRTTALKFELEVSARL